MGAFGNLRIGRLLARAASGAAALALVASATTASAGAATVATPSLQSAAGSGWGASFAIDHDSGAVTGISALSCSSTLFCAAVDGAGRVLTFSGSGWSRPRSIDADPTGFSGISCPTKDFCVATDTDGFAAIWNGSRWLGPRQIDPTRIQSELLLSVSCPTTKFCAAADSSGYALAWHGKSWSRQLVEDRFGNAVSFDAVSCASSSFCVAVDNNGAVSSWNGSSWSKPVATTTDILNAVSCLSVTFCVAVGGEAVIYNGKKWLPGESISPAQLDSVSCVSSSDCVAGDGLGSEYGWSGSRWSTGRTLSSDDGLSGISCRTAGFCSVVTSNGNAVFFAGIPSISTASLPAATVGKAYSTLLHASGGTPPFTFHAVSGLPHGLSVSAGGGISGKPTSAGKYTVKLSVTDPLHVSSSRTLALTVGK